MREIAQNFARHHGGDAGPLALVVALPALQNRFAERAGAGELYHSVPDGRAGEYRRLGRDDQIFDGERSDGGTGRTGGGE